MRANQRRQVALSPVVEIERYDDSVGGVASVSHTACKAALETTGTQGA